MPEDDLIVLHSFASEMEAEMAKGALESAGIEVLIQADSAGGMWPNIAGASGGFKLLVRPQDEADGRAILRPETQGQSLVNEPENDFAAVACRASDLEAWLALRQALWPSESAEEHRGEVEAMLRDSSVGVAFLAQSQDKQAVGFTEASLRRDYVNGCETSPVAFLEGIYVSPEFRRRGVARGLTEAVEKWAWQQGCTEFASDTDFTNRESLALHLALGFAETERVIFFRKLLA